MGKIEVNKKQKKESLLNTAFSLFTSKGFQKTSISDIVDNAGVAKGTFYLYFSDKYDLRNKLIAHKAGVLFLDAYHALTAQKVTGIEEQIIYITDYIIQRLIRDKSLLGFLSKHLSWGVFRNNLIAGTDNNEQNVYLIFMNLLHASGYDFKDPEIMIYMLIELVSGSIYNPLLYEQPVPIDAIQSYLHDSIRHIIRQHIQTESDSSQTANSAASDIK